MRVEYQSMLNAVMTITQSLLCSNFLSVRINIEKYFADYMGRRYMTLYRLLVVQVAEFLDPRTHLDTFIKLDLLKTVIIFTKSMCLNAEIQVGVTASSRSGNEVSERKNQTKLAW
jgi:hypothetical protein